MISSGTPRNPLKQKIVDYSQMSSDSPVLTWRATNSITNDNKSKKGGLSDTSTS